MILYEGSFENTLGDTISPSDTLHLIHNSTCATNTWPDTFPFCRAALKSDTLKFEIYREGADGHAALTIWAIRRKFKCRYQSSSPVPDTEYAQEGFEKQKLILNTDQWSKGATLKGKVQVHWMRDFKNGKTLEESIKGNFEAVIE